MIEKYLGWRGEVEGVLHEIPTEIVLAERDLLGRVAGHLESLFPKSKILLVCDHTTWQVAGEAVAAGFDRLGWPIDRLYVLEGSKGHAVADDRNVAHVQDALAEGGYASAIAVGSGTVNDLTKLASARLGIPYAVVATAPSMNGYASVIAAILTDGVKTTVQAHLPKAVFFDLDINAEAPYRMIASGLGDLLSRPVSNADWRLAHELKGDAYTSYPLELIGAARDELIGVAAKLPTKDRDAMAGLCRSLVLSGFAMALAGTSAPASGGEHLVSHYLDMIAIARHKEHDFHGCQVGVATVVSAALYERLWALEPEEIDVERSVLKHLPWSVYERTIEQRFAAFGLTEAVKEHAKPSYPSREELRARLHQLVNRWAEIKAFVSQPLLPAAEIQAELRKAKAPATFSAIGVSPAEACRALLHAKDIRGRYTILDLLAEIGLLEEWVDEILQEDKGLL